jgi:hypothetical protein
LGGYIEAGDQIMNNSDSEPESQSAELHSQNPCSDEKDSLNNIDNNRQNEQLKSSLSNSFENVQLSNFTNPLPDSQLDKKSDEPLLLPDFTESDIINSYGISWKPCYSNLAEELHLRHYSSKTLRAYRNWVQKFQAFVKSKAIILLSPAASKL